MSLTELERLVRTGQYTQAMRVFLDLMVNPTMARRDLAFAYHCASICAYHTAKITSAVEYARLAEENAQAVGDKFLMGKVWINQIALYHDLGDQVMAQEAGERWLREFGTAYPDLANQEARVHYNLALVQRARKNNGRAMQHFKAAVDLSRLNGLSNGFRTQAHQMYAWCLYLEGKIEQGDAQASLAAELIENDDTEAVREQLLLKCLRAYMTGTYAEAGKIAQEFVAPGIEATPKQRFWAIWVGGMILYHQKQYRASRVMAALALDVALETKSGEHMNRVSELRRLLQDAGDDPLQGEAG